MAITFRQKLGCWAHERWKTECALSPWLRRLTGIQWVDLCNRHERLRAGDDARSRVCDWQDSSMLTVARVFPAAGGRLLRHCWNEPLATSISREKISVILPVGGRDRLAAFPAVLASWRKQQVPDVELVIVEHSEEPLFRPVDNETMIYVHLPRFPGSEFNKSRCMNEGVRRATGDVVVLQDADLVVRPDYLDAAMAILDRGYDAVRPVRFSFMLDELPSDEFIRTGRWPEMVSTIVQNNPGLSTLIRRDVYFEIGGHDERFEGWGGEDREFMDRLGERRLFNGAFLPAVHLWHPPAPKKANGDQNLALTNRLRAIPPLERIKQLNQTTKSGSAHD